MAAQFCAAGGVLFSYSGAIFERSRKSLFIDYSGAKCALQPAPSVCRCDYLEFLQNNHKAPPKSLGHLRFAGTKTPAALKFSSKAPQPTALKPPSTARTVGRVIGQSVGSDASPLSCFLFRPRKRLEKRRKRSHTNVSNASITRTSTPPAQTPPHLLSADKVGTHSAFGERSHTRLTRRNRGCFRMGGAITTLGAFHTFRKPCVARCQNGKLCRFGVLVGGAPERTQRACGTVMRIMRVAVPQASQPAGLRDLFSLWRNCGFVHPALMVFRVCEAWGGITTLGGFACC